MKKRGVSRSKLKSTMPFALQRFDRQMGKYKRRHWKMFREWLGWEEKKEKNT
jgi:hypothetical protein